MTLPRAQLPNRRPSVTLACTWNGIAFTATVGFDPVTCAPREVFADTATGGQMQATLADACVLISIALQHGLTPVALAKSLAREPDPVSGEGVTRPASPIGVLLDALQAEIERLQYPMTG